MNDKENPEQKRRHRFTQSQIDEWKRDMEAKGYVTTSPYFQVIEKWLKESPP